ncbi:hypothetical protein Taro_029635 [Colocasia esculenta]|uniref:Putative plant transposon protein domain-containing protein n=1 Tax=Colocasia esculenta TaxID=4460 RepID=A0A843VJF6_COLES|nr:hypothetical protein [Colocasia esculenta]
MAASVISGNLGGYSGEFLSPEQQERFTFVKTKLCGNKAADVADLEKNGMPSVVAALSRMKWSVISTFSEVSYPDLVKAFYVCLKSKIDGSVTSSVNGIPIKIDHDLLKMLFEVSTTGHSGVHSVDTKVKGLGIVGPEYRLRDGKIDINQMNAFNRLLHFIVCQIIAPRSATFSTCTKGDSDMMFWVIQNKEINMAAVMLERMKFASDHIWDTKSKLNISLPYAHLLTKIFKFFGIDLSGTVVEKMGQAIRSRNLRKCGFSVVNGVWSKTSMVEGEAIMEEVNEVQEEVQAAIAEPVAVAPAMPEQEELASAATPVLESAAEELAAAVDSLFVEEFPEESARVAVESSNERIEDISPEEIIPFVSTTAYHLPTSIVASILRGVVDSILSTPVTSETGGCSEEEVVASGHIAKSVAATPVQEEQSGAPEDVFMEEAPIQGEQPCERQEVTEEAAHTDMPMGSVPAEGIFASSQGDGTQGEEHDNPPGREGGIPGVVPFGCEGRPGGIQGAVPFGCEGRPGEVSRVWLFPSGVKEDQPSWVL